MFNVFKGVKQGVVLSPILFSLYIDELLISLEKPGVGCQLGNRYTLLAKSKSAFTIMLNKAYEYGVQLHENFNPTKSQFLVFSNDYHECKFL
jgi:hypothetical protein